jgi:hypothetical protein
VGTGADIDVFVRRLGASGRTLVVVQIDREWTYGAADIDPGLALLTAATRASDSLARYGRTVRVAAIVARGSEELGMVPRCSGAIARECVGPLSEAPLVRQRGLAVTHDADRTRREGPRLGHAAHRSSVSRRPFDQEAE